MNVSFPSLEFFRALQEDLVKDPSCANGVEPSDAYCGFSMDDHLFVFEFDGRECSAVAAGGNPLDLDFVISGPLASWRQAVTSDPGGKLAELIEAGSLEIESDDGAEMARAAIPMLQVFIDQAGKHEVEFV